MHASACQFKQPRAQGLVPFGTRDPATQSTSHTSDSISDTTRTLRSIAVNRQNALRLLSTTTPFDNRTAVADAARALHCTANFVRRWPDELPRRIADRVIAHCFRKEVASWLAQGMALDKRYIDAAALKHADDLDDAPRDDEQLEEAA
jgi:hypothetical protein